MPHSSEPILASDFTHEANEANEANELHRQVLSALRAAVPSELAVCYAGTRDDGMHLSGSLLDGATVSPLAPLTLAEAEPRARALLGHGRALIIGFRHLDRLWGIGGVCARGRPSDALRLRQIAPLLGSLVASHERCRELARRAAQREAELSALEARTLSRVSGSHTDKLSPREREIASLLVDGYAAINAAAVLDLSEHTVRTYIRRLYRKLDVKNRADLVRTLVHAAPLGGPQHA